MDLGISRYIKNKFKGLDQDPERIILIYIGNHQDHDRGPERGRSDIIKDKSLWWRLRNLSLAGKVNQMTTMNLVHQFQKISLKFCRKKRNLRKKKLLEKRKF